MFIPTTKQMMQKYLDRLAKLDEESYKEKLAIAEELAKLRKLVEKKNGTGG